jgi:16S rRNA (uracil1498-N3)-methyltransferase
MSRARLDEISASGATAQIVETTSQPRGLCAVALPLIKKDRFELALEQCVELGVSGCIPFVSERCHLRAFSQAYMKRLRRVAASAMKQSFRAWLPEVEAPVAFGDLVARAASCPHAVFGDAGGAPAVQVGGRLLVVVGPEGGFTGEEAGALREAGARPLSLGPHRLRAGTAAAVLVAAVSGTD